MSKVFQFFQDAIKSCNVFTSPVNLRYKLDPDYNTFAGGIVSIALIVLLMSVFFNAWVQLLNKEAISSSTEVVREFDPGYMSVNSDDFMFAIGVTGLNLTDSSQKKYFNLKITKSEVINGTKTNKIFSLEACTTNHWEQLGEEFVETHKRQGLDSFLCVPRNLTFDIGGKFTSQRFIYYKIAFQKCVGRPDCRTQPQIDAWVAANASFYFNFYYSNTLLNPDKKEPISMFFQDKDYMMFSPTMVTSTNIYVGEYVMETDQSIFPWVQTKVDQGFILNRGQKQFWNYMATPTEPYCKLFLRKSNIKLEIERKFRKLDDMLSYIGGLFGIIAVAFGFVMNYYGQCCFQLEMCQNVFDYHNKRQDKDSIQQNLQSPSQQLTQKNQSINFGEGWSINEQSNASLPVIEPKDFGFMDFFLHIIYQPFKKVCNFQWRRMQIYEESLEQMRYKLDISQLMEKLAFYDRSINVLFDQNQLKLLYLQEKYNFEEVRQQRTMLGLRKDIVANLFGMVSNITPQMDDDRLDDQKKTLKQIADTRSRKKVKTFVGPPQVNLFEIFAKAGLKASSQSDDDINIPADVKTALRKLDSKIEQGDLISIRIYNGLQYELLEAFEKSKMNKNKYGVTGKKMNKKIKAAQQAKRENTKHETIEVVNLQPHLSTTSIYRIY